MRNIAIIPARGGSKRIPRKNIKPFMGKPIIAYSIEAALQSGLFDEVMVSTDDEEIAVVARQYGAKIPFMRSERTSNDFSPLADVVDEVLGFYKSRGENFDCFCCILATAPFIIPNDLIKACLRLMEADFDTIRPIVRFEYPIQRAFRLTSNQEVSFFYPEFFNSRSQDLEEAYHDAGLFYFGKCSKGLHDDNKKGGIIIPAERCQDIDDENDWRMAEFKYRLMHENE